VVENLALKAKNREIWAKPVKIRSYHFAGSYAKSSELIWVLKQGQISSVKNPQQKAGKTW